jgi:hypothetical protein
MARGTSHGLGFAKGSIIEYSDGTAEYRPTAKLMPAFRVRISDVTGVSVRKATTDDRKNLGASQEVVSIQGGGTTLAEAAVLYGTGEKIDAWFRAHPQSGSRGAVSSASTSPPPPPPAGSSVSVADELLKLAALRDAGVLTAEEFAAQKAKLLG